MTDIESGSPFELLIRSDARRIALDTLLSYDGFWVNAPLISDATQLDEPEAKSAIGFLDELGLIEHHPSKGQVRLDETAAAVPELLAAHRELHAHTEAIRERVGNAE